MNPLASRCYHRRQEWRQNVLTLAHHGGFDLVLPAVLRLVVLARAFCARPLSFHACGLLELALGRAVHCQSFGVLQAPGFGVLHFHFEALEWRASASV